MTGKQISTESIVYRKRVYTAAVSERNYELMNRLTPYMIENGGTIPVDLRSTESEAVEEMICRAAQVMGIENGTIKGDIILTTGGPVAIEFAARLSGGYLATDQIPLARGVDLVKQTIKLALGEELDASELIPRDLCYMGIRYFFPDPGRITHIEGFDELDELDWVSKKLLFLKEGDTVENTSNHTNRVGFVHTVGSTFEEATQRVIKAAQMVRIQTSPVLRDPTGGNHGR